MLEYVMLDLDETLFDFRRSEVYALTRLLESIGVVPSGEVLQRYSEINISRWKLLEQGLLTRQQVKESRYEILFAELGVSVSPAAATAYYEEQLSQKGYLLPETTKLLEALYDRYKLYAVSNGGTKVQRGRLADSGIGVYFDDIFISEEIGAEKPSRDFFAACVEAIKRETVRALQSVSQSADSELTDKSMENIEDSCVIIGDSLTSDIQGGINAGIRTIWYNPDGVELTGDIRPDYQVRRLMEIPELLTAM